MATSGTYVDTLEDRFEMRVEAIVPHMERLVLSMGYQAVGPDAPSVTDVLLAQKGEKKVVLTLAKPFGRWWLHHRIQMTLGFPIMGAAHAESLSWWATIWPTGANVHVQPNPGVLGSNTNPAAFPTRLKPRDVRLRRRFSVSCLDPAESHPVLDTEPLRSALLACPEVDFLVRDDSLAFADLEAKLLGKLGGLATEPTDDGQTGPRIPFRKLVSRYVATDARVTALLTAAVETLWATQSTRSTGRP